VYKLFTKKKVALTLKDVQDALNINWKTTHNSINTLLEMKLIRKITVTHRHLKYYELNTIVRNEFDGWFEENLIYCSTTNSFVCRLFKLRKAWKDKNDAINDAFEVLSDMEKEFQLKHKRDKNAKA
jgi:hypothetical protein